MASANNTYNFYFVKDGVEKKQALKEEVVDSALPSDAKPAEEVSVPKATSLSASLEKPAEEKNYKLWSLALGVGWMRGSYFSMNSGVQTDDMFFGGGPASIDYNQRLYAVEGRFAFNRYFDVG